jgi:hypothetical protein
MLRERLSGPDSITISANFKLKAFAGGWADAVLEVGVMGANVGGKFNRRRTRKPNRTVGDGAFKGTGMVHVGEGSKKIREVGRNPKRELKRRIGQKRVNTKIAKKERAWLQ